MDTINANQNLKVILIDIDDTFTKSSEKIINVFNMLNNTDKNIYDIKHYNYIDIDPNATAEQVIEMYNDPDFYKDIQFYSGAIDFVNKYDKIFKIIFTTRGTPVNVAFKQNLIKNLAQQYQWQNVDIVGLPLDCDKSEIEINNVYIAIDNESRLLDAVKSPNKILFKGMLNTDGNQVLENSNWYSVNHWAEIDKIIEFSLDNMWFFE